MAGSFSPGEYLLSKARNDVDSAVRRHMSHHGDPAHLGSVQVDDNGGYSEQYESIHI